MAGSRIHYSSFASYIMWHYYIKKSYGPTELGIVVVVVVVAVVVVSHIQRIGCQPEKNYFTRWPIPLVIC